MDTSLAEEVQQTMATLAPNRFFFMPPGSRTGSASVV
jgi:isochorismate synthase